MIGLVEAVKIHPEFPTRESRATNLGPRQYIFFLLTLSSVTTTVLAILGKLSVLFGSILSTIILASLLAYGYISEGTFIKLYLGKKEVRKKISEK